MEEVKKPTWEEIMQQPWVQAARGLLQFVGGGLVALRHETGDAAEREVLDTLADLGLSNNHAGDVRRGWDAAGAPPSGSQPVAPTAPERSVPSLSFDDFVRGAAELGVVPLVDMPGRAQNPDMSPVPSATSPSEVAADGPGVKPQSQPDTSRLPRSLEELVRTAPPAKSSSGARTTTAPPVSAPAVEISTRAREESDRIVDERISRLEERLRMLTEALSSNGLEQDKGAAEELPGDVEPVMPTDLVLQEPGTESPVEREHGGPKGQRELAKLGDGSTVVQGPWFKSQHPAVAESGDLSASGPKPSDARERKLEQLERTLGTFEKMVEGIVARSRAKGQPPA